MVNYREITENFSAEIAQADTSEALYNVKVKYLGKKGLISLMNKELASLSAEERPVVGAEIKKVRDHFESLHQSKEEELKSNELNTKLMKEKLDVTMPAMQYTKGSVHPVSMVCDEIVDIFTAMGYSVETGPEAELDYYNFEALNMPANHPARAMHDTFYLAENVVMRTHTSPVQVRTMESRKPPIKIIAPGRVYRSDYDLTHTPMFHQIEGLLIDENISFAHLKGTLSFLIKSLFGQDVPVRFRPSFFPFTEPSVEVDMGCTLCNNTGCRVCKNTGWLEILGSGMVAPEVLKMSNIDTDKYSGFAFGMGLERIAMIKYGIDDLRLFFDNHMKFLTQFN